MLRLCTTSLDNRVSLPRIYKNLPTWPLLDAFNEQQPFSGTAGPTPFLLYAARGEERGGGRARVISGLLMPEPLRSNSFVAGKTIACHHLVWSLQLLLFFHLVYCQFKSPLPDIT